MESFVYGLTDTQFVLLVTAFVILAIWDVIWKAIAMWEAAKQGSKVWFVLLLIVNSFGILPIAYLWYQGKLFGGKKSEAGDGV